MKATNMTLHEYFQHIETAAKFSARSGIDGATLSRFRNGVQEPSEANAVLIENLTHGHVSRKVLKKNWAQIWPELANGDTPIMFYGKHEQSEL